MLIPLEFYNELRQQIRLSDVIKQKVSLTKKNHAYLGLCPFHSEKTPSFTVNDQKRFYYCFGCGASGDVIKFISETTGLSYKESAIKIAGDFGIELPKMTKAQKVEYEESDKIYQILELACVFFARGLNKETREYLAIRGVEDNVIKEFGIGYSHKKGQLIKYFEKKSIFVDDLLKSGLVGKNEDGKIYEVFTNRIMFPIRNIYNKIVGFGGRVIGNALPKYINSPETLVFKKSETMYGENVGISASYKKNQVIVVEGYMDVIALHKSGIHETLASLGTSVTEKHLQKLWRSCDEIIICLDGDAAGKKAGFKLINMALPMIGANNKISFVLLPNSKDPDDIINSAGPELFYKLIRNRIDLSEAIWKIEYEGKNFVSAESKAKLEQKFKEYCAQITDQVLAANFRRYFKEQIWGNLFKKKSIDKKNKSYLTNNIDRKYTEMEVIELSLCSFILQFPVILKNSEAKEFLSDLVLSSEELTELKDWFINNVEIEENVTFEQIEELVKNTRFYNSFNLLSDPDKTFLDISFVTKNQENISLIFDLLAKKHYLLSLKQEYINIMNGANDDKELKASFFLKEIQKVSEKLIKLNDFFM